MGARNGASLPAKLKSKPHRFGKRNRRFDSPRRQCDTVFSGSVYF
jgi:hypothetical protein